jgi:NAD(P)-dependent dehydrogenase (short-subunit alcohol dehydrogenase family)
LCIKAAVILFTQALALELAESNILVNCVCPGPSDTDMPDKEALWASALVGGVPEDFKKKWTDSVPLKRMAKPAEIAKVFVFLASEYADFVTGAAINVSGGAEMH